MAAAFTTMSLNDGAGSVTSLSRWRSSTALVMSTSSESAKSGAVAFDSAIRRDTVCWRRESSCTSASPLAPLSRAGSARPFSLGAASSSASGSAFSFAGAPSPLAAASTSAFTIRPPGPLPSSWASSTPSSPAMRRATGDAFTRPAPFDWSSLAGLRGFSSAGSGSASGSSRLGLGLGSSASSSSTA